MVLHIIHSFNEKRADEHTNREAAFMITNKKGNYLSLGKDNFSHMQGLFFFDHDNWGLYKTIEDIKLNKELTALKNNIVNVQRIYKDGAEESFNLFNNSLVYSVKNYSGDIILELDFREIFNHDDKGRIYTVTQEEDCIIIRYDKFNDDSLSRTDKTCFMVIKGEGLEGFKMINQWVKKHYSYDARRKCPSQFYIYKAMSLHINHNAEMVFSFANTKEKAKEHARNIYEDRQYLIKSFYKYVKNTFVNHELALNIAMKALDDLLISTENKERGVGIFAGLPWFYQFWARDELISLKALMLQEKHYLVKSILFKYLTTLTDVGSNGLIQSRHPGTPDDVKSIDSTGWLFFRVNEYINLLESKKIINEYLPEADLMLVKRVLENVIHCLLQSNQSTTGAMHGLIVNDEQESWMDTKPAHRRGACIEVQALFLVMLNLHNRLASMTKSKKIFNGMEKEYKERVRKEFFNNNTGVLYDSITKEGPSNTIRPNIFLAHYLYPGMLSKKEWKAAFDNALKALWLDWGGLATLNYTNPLFRSEYTGSDDASYHNGDSWYYINNYAALAMQRLDSSYYAKHVKRIIHASTEEMLFSGFIGCCAEVSSAKQMRSEGCMSQAWSNASLIELLYEIHGYNT